MCFAVDENSKESSLHRILEEEDQRSRLFFSVINEEVHKEWQFCNTFSKQGKIPNASEIELSILMNKDMHCFVLVLQH